MQPDFEALACLYGEAMLFAERIARLDVGGERGRRRLRRIRRRLQVVRHWELQKLPVELDPAWSEYRKELFALLRVFDRLREGCARLLDPRFLASTKGVQPQVLFKRMLLQFKKGVHLCERLHRGGRDL